ncbi:cryptochrome/photolyase family protein [Halobacteriales archaeon SW_7_68_16]|nr:MAG: cryptochrome/photolyase family protein [Halobacteriales archaeon SW_7_68_16]
MDRTIWILGDQLTDRAGPLTDAEAGDRVLMIESRAFARRYPYHPHKLVLVFAAMRHFRDRLRDAGYEVVYERAETFADGLDAFCERFDDDLVVMRPAGHGATDRLRSLAAERDRDLDVVSNPQFLLTPAEFDEWAGDDDRYKHEQFYRFMRRRTGYLMADGEPVGGAWNFDDDNRETPPDDYEPPASPRYEPDAITHEVIEWVHDEFAGGYEEEPFGVDWADPEPFFWPVTREQARDALDRFVGDRLSDFGPYQDAMVEGEWAMNHALLSSSINCGLLGPAEVVERVLDGAREDPDVPVNSVEGFVRQVIGWREFMRHVYRREMPALAEANQLDATEPLPDLFWTGETEMACLSAVIDGVRKRGYSHHIERLMILSNFVTTYGASPQEFNRWFNAAYVDAYHWVTTPNVVGMGVFGTDVLSTKPYASSANYIDKMSDHCSSCPYYKTKTTGEGACPFNALYWDFLGRNEDDLRSNHRMGLVYSHWDDKTEAEREAIHARADAVRELAEDGDL